MDRQRTIHEESWEELKPSDDAVEQKPRVRRTIEILKGLVEPGDSVYDLGCGAGVIGREIAPRDGTVTIDGCDISKEAVERARAHYQTVYRVNVDEEELPVSDETYDVVICTDVLEHVIDPELALSELGRILKPGGYAVISVPNYGYVRYRIDAVRGRVPSILTDRRHFHAYSVDSLHALLEETSLTPATITGVGRYETFSTQWPRLFAKTIIQTAQRDQAPGI